MLLTKVNWWLVLVVLLLTVLVVLAVWPLPSALMQRMDVSLPPSDYVAAVAATRSALLTAVATLGATVTLAVALASYRTSRAGAFTDRYGRAVDQLGAEGLAVRIGGVYALGRLGDDSAFDRRAAGDVLCAFIRAAQPQYESDGEERVAADVQAALDVIGGAGNRSFDVIDLTGAQLAGAALRNLDFSKANLTRTDLSGASLEKCNLRGATLKETDFRGAHLQGAKFRRALFEATDLRGAVLDDNALSRAQIEAARMT